jgi:multisubunit Na+/H+ antiporter MnhE subunit
MTMFNELTDFILGVGFNLAVALLIVRFIYYPFTQNKNYVFTFLAFSTIIYFVLGLFTSTDLSVGVGFGLFAIFSVLRYRTDEMPIREMTYLFIIIALPVMNSILMSNGDVMKLLVANGVIVALLYVLEKEWGFHFEASKKITYEKIDLITPANRDYLLADLRQRTGLPIKRAEVGRLDFLHDTAEIRIFYDEPQPAAPVIGTQTGARNFQAHQQPTLRT